MMKLHTRLKLLQEAFECFQQITQWIPWAMHHATEYHHKAEVLINILEVQDCGSIGGFDRENPMKRITGYELYDRFLTVLAKHNNESDLKEACYFTPQTLGDYFKKARELRETFNK
ncbi:unnamed protein product [marine sediment metagenome]|uniref:HEPN domain-containing protein n=1 Tax=marine sediment metagenome TaxID=412755 RepID=X0SLK0_9ZZZZ